MTLKTTFVTLLMGAMVLLCPAYAAAPVSGAIFTTGVDGTIVNANVQYASKCDVYLNGGPGENAPVGAAGLAAGEYYFQVTDPSGQKLLSTDVVTNRRVRVNASGVIDAYTGVGGLPHPLGVNRVHPESGAITIRLANASCPVDFLDTANDGGVYKVWMTPVTAFVGDPAQVDNACGSGCYHGFVPSKSKTDNFKIRPTTATFCLTIVKEVLAFDGSIVRGYGWPMAVTDSAGVTNSYYTDGLTGAVSVCDLVAGTYTVTEAPRAGYEINGLNVNGVTLPPQGVYAFLWTERSPNPFVVTFRNKMLDIPEQ